MMRYSFASALVAVAAWAVPSACHHLPGNRQLRSIRGNATQPDLQELADKLSPGAEILLPGDGDFDTATLRWSILDPPTFSLVVVPSVEEDVAETVRFLEMALDVTPVLRRFLGEIREQEGHSLPVCQSRPRSRHDCGETAERH